MSAVAAVSTARKGVRIKGKVNEAFEKAIKGDPRAMLLISSCARRSPQPIRTVRRLGDVTQHDLRFRLRARLKSRCC